MLRHIRHTNWTCKVPNLELHRQCDGKPPEIKYTLNTTSRVSYGDPHVLYPFMKNYKTPTTRFGCSRRDGPVTGIVPNVLPPIAKENVPEGKKIEDKTKPNT
ncbi:uncharacterized protein [Ptychodera flava]|uniref:uncharacterized protein n=1 Tax=Ptychodera flava TaxID=63121 RepID=UPI00396AAF41